MQLCSGPKKKLIKGIADLLALQSDGVDAGHEFLTPEVELLPLPQACSPGKMRVKAKINGLDFKAQPQSSQPLGLTFKLALSTIVQVELASPVSTVGTVEARYFSNPATIERGMKEIQ